MGCIGPSIVVFQFGSLYKLSRYDVTFTLHNLQVLGRDFQSQFHNGQTISKLSPPTHQRTRSRPHPTWETKLYLPVPLKDTKESNESSRRLFLQLSTIQPLNAKKKKKVRQKGTVYEGSEPKTLVVSENVLMSLHVRIHFI